MPGCYRANLFCEALQPVNDLTSKGERVYLGTIYSYWLQPDGGGITAAEFGLATHQDAASRRAELFANGFEMVVIDKTPDTYDLRQFDPAAAPAWLDVRLVSTNDPLIVYALASRDPVRKAALTCRARGRGGWRLSLPNRDRTIPISRSMGRSLHPGQSELP